MTTDRGVAEVLIRCVGETNLLQNDDALQLPDRKEQGITLILISALGTQAETMHTLEEISDLYNYEKEQDL